MVHDKAKDAIESLSSRVGSGLVESDSGARRLALRIEVDEDGGGGVHRLVVCSGRLELRCYRRSRLRVGQARCCWYTEEADRNGEGEDLRKEAGGCGGWRED